MANQQTTNIFTVKLNNLPDAYFPGDIVSGSVIINYFKEKVVENILVLMYGRSTLISPDRGVIGTTRTYFCQRCEISLFRYANEKVKIPAGLNEFPFSYELPSDLPSSFSGGYGNISCKVKAIMLRSGTLSNSSTVKCVFNVRGIMNLNTNVENRNPISICSRLSWDSKKTITCKFNMAQSGFVAGDFLLCNLEVDNQSNKKEIKRIVISLVQHATFITNQTNRNISTISGPSVPAYEKYSWIIDSLQIPPNIPPTQSCPSHLILIKYEIRIDITVGTSVRCFVVPVTIGIIPLTTIYHQHQSETNLQISAAMPSSATYGEYAPLELPPPSYQEAMRSSTQKFKLKSQVAAARNDR